MQVKFYVYDYKKDKKGKAPFEVIITVNNTRAKFTLDHKINPKEWDNKKQVFIYSMTVRHGGMQFMGLSAQKGLDNWTPHEQFKHNNLHNQILNHLNAVRLKLYEAENRLMELGYAIDAQTIKAMYQGKIKGKKYSLTEYYNDFLETKNKRVGKEIVRDTYQKYETTLKHFKTFLKAKYRRDDIQLTEINISMINAFFSYLLDIMENNSAVGYMKKLKAVVSHAQQDKIIETNPMDRFKTHIEKKEIVYLTKEELSTIYKKEIENERLGKVRDLFVFACFTGLSFVDLMNFDTKKHIKKDQDENTYILKERTKTSVEANIPLLPIAKEILEKYFYSLPTLSNQKYNSYLKEIQDICNIKKSLHSHVARHRKFSFNLKTNSLQDNFS